MFEPVIIGPAVILDSQTEAAAPFTRLCLTLLVKEMTNALENSLIVS